AKPRRSRNRSPVQATSAPRAGTWYRAALRPLVPPLAHPPASLVRSRPALQFIALQSPTPVAEAEHAVVAAAEADRAVAEEVTARTFRPRYTPPKPPQNAPPTPPRHTLKT